MRVWRNRLGTHVSVLLLVTQPVYVLNLTLQLHWASLDVCDEGGHRVRETCVLDARSETFMSEGGNWGSRRKGSKVQEACERY
jgi:hypothetical protein